MSYLIPLAWLLAISYLMSDGLLRILVKVYYYLGVINIMWHFLCELNPTPSPPTRSMNWLQIPDLLSFYTFWILEIFEQNRLLKNKNTAKTGFWRIRFFQEYIHPCLRHHPCLDIGRCTDKMTMPLIYPLTLRPKVDHGLFNNRLTIWQIRTI